MHFGFVSPSRYFAPVLIGWGLAVLASAAWAEKADRDKPMNIESDALRYDDANQVSVFTGNVVITKGTILIRGEQVEVRQDPAGNQTGVATAAPGQLAFFRQKREALDEFIEGEGQRIEYDSQADVVRFMGAATMRRLRGSTVTDESAGQRIVYNNTTSVFTVEGDGKTPTANNPSGRVRAMLTPKPNPAADASAPKPQAAPGTPLKPSRTLREPAQ